jgi:Kinesin motor domain
LNKRSFLKYRMDDGEAAEARGIIESSSSTTDAVALEVQRSANVRGVIRERQDAPGDPDEQDNLSIIHPRQSQARINGSGPLSVSICSPEVGGRMPTSDTNSSHNDNENDDDGYTSVQVAVRIRPTLEDDDDDCIKCLLPPPQYLGPASSSLGATPLKPRRPSAVPQTLQVGGSKGPVFTFDRVFGKASRQAELYHSVVAPLVTNCLEGYNATVLACTFSSNARCPVC